MHIVYICEYHESLLIFTKICYKLITYIYMCLSKYIYTIHGGKPYEQTYLMNHKYPM